MTGDRRNDIGEKLLISAISALLGIIGWMTWGTATRAQCEVSDNRVKIGRIEEGMIAQKEMLSEIKTDIKDVKRLVIREYAPRPGI